MAEGKILDRLREAFGKREASVVENIVSQATSEPTEVIIMSDNPVLLNEAEAIPTPEGEEWELQGIQIMDPEGGPLKTYYIWVKE